jgi:hypothetical protein
LIVGIHIGWKKIHPELNKEISKKKRLDWIKNLLQIENLTSITELPDEQLLAVYKTIEFLDP